MTRPPVPGLVSVVVASYNHARYLPRRMESLLEQTYTNLEIIVIDDRSPDDSVPVLRRYETDPRIRLVALEKNEGWVAVSNRGIEMASGEYVIFANCDDDCAPRMIERLVDALERNSTAGIAFCRSLMVDEESRVLGQDIDIQERPFRNRCSADTLITRDEMARFLLHACVIPNLSAALFRRVVFESSGVLSSEFKACSDWELFFRVARGYDVAYVAEPLNLFRQHATTIRSSMKERDTFEEYFTLLLGEARRLPLSFTGRARARRRVMQMWSVHLLSQTMSGWGNFRYHLALIRRFDSAALWFLPLALISRAGELVRKVVFRSSRSRLSTG